MAANPAARSTVGSSRSGARGIPPSCPRTGPAEIGGVARPGERPWRMLSDHWPMFDLRIRTPRLELRYPSDDDLALLVALLDEPIHDPDFMPFLIPWTRAEPPE